MRVGSCLFFAGLLMLSTSSVCAGPATRYWLTQKSEGLLRITECGGLCGQIVWLRQAVDPKGQPVRDIHNRDESLRGRPLMGPTTFSGLKPNGVGAMVRVDVQPG